jgi:hypothetical protein
MTRLGDGWLGGLELSTLLTGSCSANAMLGLSPHFNALLVSSSG